MNAEIAIIGGSGVYDPALIKNPKELKVHTPYGATSDLITVGEYMGKSVAFLPRHGRNHTHPPHKINYRANIWALKSIGVSRILAPQAVGSLREEFKPGTIVIPDQFIDFTKGRALSFYDSGKVYHISSANPFCTELRSLLSEAGKKLNIKTMNSGTYVCIEGPRFSTRAESKMFRILGADIIGMTLVPEINLARELEMCYSSVAMVTDYDVWKEDNLVSMEKILDTMKTNLHKTKSMLSEAIKNMPSQRNCECKTLLSNAEA